MSSATVNSKNNEEKYTASVAGSAFITTENTLEVPPQEQVYEMISSYIEEKGNMEIQTGDSKLREDGTLEFGDGTIITMVNPKAYQSLLEIENGRKAKSTKKVSKVQSGEIR